LLGLSEVLDALQITNAPEVKEELGSLMVDCLMLAFVSLRELRKCFGDDTVPELTKTKHFNDMYGSLWTAYKDRMQKVTRLLHFDIGFLFQNDDKFAKGCTTFSAEHPEIHPDFFQLLKWNRGNWQSQLAKFRNEYLQHQTLKPENVKTFYVLNAAERTFDCVWIAIEDIIGVLASTKLSPSVRLAELPDSRGTTAMKRFCFVWAEGVKFETPPKSAPTR
jgi:hypothetical protein